MAILYHECRFGLARGAVYRDGKPHLYLEGYDHDSSLALLGTRSVARVTGRGGGVVFLELADGGEAVLDAPTDQTAALSDGTAVEVEISAEARQDKAARARLIRPASGETPRRLSPPQTLKARLMAAAQALMGVEVTDTIDEDDRLDMAAESAQALSGPLPGGGYLSIERTRALIACDVDSAGGEGRNFIRQCNEAAIGEVARRLHLSGLAGLVVIDLIGKRHDGDRLQGLLKQAFGPEPVISAPLGKFGTLEFVRPWGMRPLADADPDLRQACGLLREAARQASGHPGRRLTLRAAPGVLDIVRPLIANSLDPLAPMLRLETGQTAEVIA